MATIIEQTRKRAAASLWEKAQIASNLRHSLVQANDKAGARAVSRIKQTAVFRASQIAPDLVSVVPDHADKTLFSVSFRHRGRLHVPMERFIGVRPF
jgi:hypothetical protein